MLNDEKIVNMTIEWFKHHNYLKKEEFEKIMGKCALYYEKDEDLL